jgi:hypothetical protein
MVLVDAHAIEAKLSREHQLLEVATIKVVPDRWVPVLVGIGHPRRSVLVAVFLFEERERHEVERVALHQCPSFDGTNSRMARVHCSG